MKMYFGGDSFMYGEGLEREETVPYLISDALQCQYYDASQNSSSNKLIYLRAMNTLFSEDSYDLYFIMWSRGMDRRFEKILDYDLSERWVNIIPHQEHEKKDKIRNDINKFVMERLVTDDSSFLNNLIYMVSLQEVFKKYNKKYVYAYAHNDFLTLYSKYKDFKIDVKDDVLHTVKTTKLNSLVEKLDSTNILDKSFTEFIDLQNPNTHPSSQNCVEFTKYFMEKYILFRQIFYEEFK